VKMHEYPPGESSAAMCEAVKRTAAWARADARFNKVSPTGRCTHASPACADCMAHDAETVTCGCCEHDFACKAPEDAGPRTCPECVRLGCAKGTEAYFGCQRFKAERPGGRRT
jgi:hypothetical protein